ncbi:aldo-keto reductase family 1 member B1-like [Euwallacea fornicatus]|uniref:aldo-keto reductase family 1 member B1-like n=1 Tax=Euwallacea fornicatus TaxID=995702 RepID=UPI00338DB582
MSVPRFVHLNNGVSLPTIGLGTYKSPKGQVEEAVKAAIDIGYRHFDCAWYYGNETEVGSAIKEKINSGTVKREDIFVTSKLWNNFHARDAVIPKLKESLTSLGLEYLDLYLIHWPFGIKQDGPPLPSENAESFFTDDDYVETWKGMEDAQKLGLTKSIGLSNFNSEQVERILKNATIKPVVNQVECNPNLTQKKLISYCKERDIVIVGYTPLGRVEVAGQPGFPDPTILDAKVIAMSKKYNKTAAQIVLNYLVNNLGVVVIPKSVTPSRIKENFEIYDFVLDAEDETYLDSRNNGQRVAQLTPYKTHKYYPFNIDF